MFRWSEVCGARPAVMGILNVTPDSFSDGGRFDDPGAAVDRAHALVAAGADLVDVGGESTRPGAEPVGVEDERARVVPVVARLASDLDAPISVDTTKSAVAAAALDAGARVVNDVSAGRFDPALLEVAAARGAGVVLMHMLGEPRTMQDAPKYTDVVTDVGDFLIERLAVALDAGVSDDSLCADPGIGFGKTVEHNLQVLARLDELVERVGVPLLVGTSRKRFLGVLLRDVVGDEGEPPPERRDDATLATSVLALDAGARVLRVHEPRSAAHAVALLDAMRVAA